MFDKSHFIRICKGPEWKPGIFVQFTKEHGISRAAGLKPGDQILSCNGIDFSDIFFNEAVSIMKSSNHLELMVRTAVGVDLFPGESSGYNSSASSVTGGDQSPCWNDMASKKNNEVESRNGEALSNSPFIGSVHSKMKSPFRPKSWCDKGALDFERSRKERLLPVTTPKVPQLTSFQALNLSSSMANICEKSQPEEVVSSNVNHANTTIIKLSENGTIINNTLIPNSSVIPPQRAPAINSNNHNNTSTTTLVTVESVNENGSLAANTSSDVSSGTKTVFVEVHRGFNDQQQHHHHYMQQQTQVVKPNKAPPPPPPTFAQNNRPSQEPKPNASSLCTSLSDEIKKKAEVTMTKI